MSYAPDALIAEDIESYLQQHENKDLLRFITCGSVDDGKSTLIGRLLFDAQMLFEDQLATIEKDSRRWGTQADALDLALLVDGLAAEREQGITIDVAYRFFATDQRKFIVADTPGHEQYTRNMVTGASTATAAVILIDARHGILTQTCRHSYLVHLLGIRHIVLAINKMDLVGYSQNTFTDIVDAYRDFAKGIGLDHFTAIPVSALNGDNIIHPSQNMPWFHGSTLIGYLETVDVDEQTLAQQPLRFPVQWVNRPHLDFRGFAGTIVAGQLAPGDSVRILPSGKTSQIARIVTHAGDLDRADAGQAVTLTLTDEIDISRGSVLCSPDTPAQVADQFAAHIIWMHEEPLYPGRSYILKSGTHNDAQATVTAIKYRENINTLEHMAADKLELNEIGVCNISLNRPIVFDPYSHNRDMGSFIIIDRLSHHTVGVGLIHFALRRAHNIHPQHLDINQAARAALKGHKPGVLWFTGLSGSGKSTIANQVEQRLHALGAHTYLLDGDNIRHGLNRDLGFTQQDRVENIRRIAEVSRLFVDAGLIVLTAFISPFRSERDLASERVAGEAFLEIYVDTPLEVAEQRDPKGLYRKARRGELKNFTGVDSPYEPPAQPDLVLDTTCQDPAAAADAVIALLRERQWIA